MGDSKKIHWAIKGRRHTKNAIKTPGKGNIFNDFDDFLFLNSSTLTPSRVQNP